MNHNKNFKIFYLIVTNKVNGYYNVEITGIYNQYITMTAAYKLGGKDVQSRIIFDSINSLFTMTTNLTFSKSIKGVLYSYSYFNNGYGKAKPIYYDITCFDECYNNLEKIDNHYHKLFEGGYYD